MSTLSFWSIWCYFNQQKMCFSFKNKDISKWPQTFEGSDAPRPLESETPRPNSEVRYGPERAHGSWLWRVPVLHTVPAAGWRKPGPPLSSKWHGGAGVVRSCHVMKSSSSCEKLGNKPLIIPHQPNESFYLLLCGGLRPGSSSCCGLILPRSIV
jgi:hypothetical protein